LPERLYRPSESKKDASSFHGTRSMIANDMMGCSCGCSCCIDALRLSAIKSVQCKQGAVTENEGSAMKAVQCNRVVILREMQ
jgi:hypothetical protein